MGTLARRVERLEQREIEAAVEDNQLEVHEMARQLGMPLESVKQAFRGYLKVRRITPVDQNGNVDLEPAIRRLAAGLGLDPDETVAEAERILAERGLLVTE